MTFGTVFPAAPIAQISGTWSAYNAGVASSFATNAITFLGDSSDTTWVQPTALPDFARNVYMSSGFANPSLGSNQVVRVRVVARLGGSSRSMVVGVLDSSSNQVSYVNGVVSGASTKSYQGNWAFSNQAAGTVWTAADIDGMTMYANDYSLNLKFAQIRLEYDYYATPTGTPTSASPVTDRPAISWSYSQAESVTQSSAHVKVFSSTQYGAGGFDPDTSTSLYATVVAGAGVTVTPETGIVTNGQVYKPYVRVIADAYGIPVKGAWTPSAAAYTASFTAPAAPTMTAVWSNATTGAGQKAVTVTLTGQSDPYRYNLLCNGTALVTLGTASATGTTTYIDRLMPRGTAVTYTSQWVTGVAASPQLTGAITTTNVTTGTATGWEFTSLDSAVTVSDYASPVSDLSFTRAEANATFRPLGSTKSVVVAGDMTGDDGTLTWIASNAAAFTTVKSLLTYQGVLRVTSPFTKSAGGNESWVIRLTSRDWKPSGTLTNPVTTANASFVEVNPVDSSVA
jgi:hypothetical protein